LDLDQTLPWASVARIGGFEVVWAPTDANDPKPYAVTDRRQQVLRRFATKASARRAARKLDADERLIDDAVARFTEVNEN